MLEITTFTASVATLFFITISVRVILLRRKYGISVGMEGDEKFVRASRAQANFAEYTPFFLILLGLAEMQIEEKTLLGFLAILFLVGRVLHYIGFGILGKGKGRVFGMAFTNTVLACLALILLTVIAV